MREIIGHKLNPAKPEPLVITAEDEAAYGANHHYKIGYQEGDWSQHVHFQKGPIGEVGVNGVTHEALIAILIDRLQCLQKGPYPCAENEAALAHLAMAQSSLFARTASRIQRGVEGINAT